MESIWDHAFKSLYLGFLRWLCIRSNTSLNSFPSATVNGLHQNGLFGTTSVQALFNKSIISESTKALCLMLEELLLA